MEGEREEDKGLVEVNVKGYGSYLVLAGPGLPLEGPG
jgi:hypothetical protein